MKRSLACLLLFAALTACTTRHAAPGKGRPPQAPPPPSARTLALYAFDPALCPTPSEQPVSAGKAFSVSRIHFPDRDGSLFPGSGMDAVAYQPAGHEGPPGAGILILPIQGGDYEVSTYFAEYFASRGFACLRVERRAEWLVPDRELNDLAPLVREFVTDVRRGLHWWRNSGRVDSKRVGLFGVSMGAIVGATVAALEGPGIRASVLVLGGGPLSEILMTADDKEINAFRELWMERCAERGTDLGTQLHTILDPVDPLRVVSRIPPASTLMIQGRFDRVVRPRLGKAFWEAAGCPDRMLIPTGHYSSVLLIHSIRRKALRWFETWLLPAS